MLARTPFSALTTTVRPSSRRCVAAVLARTISTQPQPDKQEILNRQRSVRPVSPFHIYQPQLLSGTSIFHRIAGVGLSLSFYGVFLSYAAAPLFGYTLDSATILDFVAGLPSWLHLSLKAAFAGAISYKALTGIRHLIWDAGKLFSLKSSYMMTYVGLGIFSLSTAGLLML
ncbi:hypothetical protein JCM10207_002908 [Rhodosporidiobolus poonsookiae]